MFRVWLMKFPSVKELEITEEVLTTFGVVAILMKPEKAKEFKEAFETLLLILRRAKNDDEWRRDGCIII